MTFDKHTRERIVAAYQEAGATYPKVAKRFDVSERFVRQVVKLWREQGTVERPPSVRKPRSDRMPEAAVDTLAEALGHNDGLTGKQLSDVLFASTGLRYSKSTINDAVSKRLAFSTKLVSRV